jgi:hypothetical protein
MKFISLLKILVAVVGILTFTDVSQAQRLYYGPSGPSFYPPFRGAQPNVQYQYRYYSRSNPPPWVVQPMPGSTPMMMPQYYQRPRCYRTGAYDQYGNARVVCY